MGLLYFQSATSFNLSVCVSVCLSVSIFLACHGWSHCCISSLPPLSICLSVFLSVYLPPFSWLVMLGPTAVFPVCHLFQSVCLCFCLSICLHFLGSSCLVP